MTTESQWPELGLPDRGYEGRQEASRLCREQRAAACTRPTCRRSKKCTLDGARCEMRFEFPVPEDVDFYAITDLRTAVKRELETKRAMRTAAEQQAETAAAKSTTRSRNK